MHRWVLYGLLVLAMAATGCGISTDGETSGDVGVNNVTAGNDVDEGPDEGMDDACGNGEVDEGELCDIAIPVPLEGCCPFPEFCVDGDPCTVDKIANDGTCQADCDYSEQVQPSGDMKDMCCPDGATNATDADCEAMETCGNGVVDEDEACDPGITAGAGACITECMDDGNPCTIGSLNDSDPCNPVCEQTTITEPINADGCCPDGATMMQDSDCPPDAPVCGDGVVEGNEMCDTAITSGEGTCLTLADCDDNNACTVDVLLGDGTCNPACGSDGQPGAGAADGCCPTGADANTDPDCGALCGNGTPEPGEGCDDGNTTGGDGCSATCQTEECGNGTVDIGEGCDDGNTASGDGCSATCEAEGCGNGTVDAGEQCDDGNTNPGDGCSAACQNEECGNGVLDPGETCDDGNTASGDGCSATCTMEACGNGVVDAGEECDDGNSMTNDSCPDGASGTCQNAFCGDGFVWNTDGGTEECEGGDNCVPPGQAEECMFSPIVIIDASIDASINECPDLFNLNAIPSTIRPDQRTARIQTNTQDPDDGPQPLEVTLMATVGTLGELTVGFGGVLEALYTCPVDFAGDVTISVLVSDGDTDCDKSKQIVVVCPDPVVEATNAD